MIRGTRRTLALVLVAAALTPAAAIADDTFVTIPGSPVRITVGEASGFNANVGGQENVFHPGNGPIGIGGFYLGLPDAVGSLPAGTIMGSPSATAITSQWTAELGHGAATGTGSASDPFRQVTVYGVNDGTVNALVVTQTITYVNGTREFRVDYRVANAAGVPIRYRASTGYDLFLDDDHFGAGFLTTTTPRFLGGLGARTGLAGGIEEVTPWSHYGTGLFSRVFDSIANVQGPGFGDFVDRASTDNGVGAQWDDHYSAGLQPGASATYSVIWSFDSPPPVLGEAANVVPVKGRVLVKLPGARGAAAAAQKGTGFVPLTQARQIPVGSLLDTSRGKVRLTSAATGRATQTAEFTGGVFQVLQSRRRSQKGLTELKLSGGSYKGCGKATKGKRATASRRSKRRIRKLRGNGKGRFRSRGRYSSATVRGTDWTVTDRCDGTLTTVKRGRVVVRDFRRSKNVVVRSGRRYFARAP